MSQAVAEMPPSTTEAPKKSPAKKQKTDAPVPFDVNDYDKPGTADVDTDAIKKECSDLRERLSKEQDKVFKIRNKLERYTTALQDIAEAFDPNPNGVPLTIDQLVMRAKILSEHYRRCPPKDGSLSRLSGRAEKPKGKSKEVNIKTLNLAPSRFIRCPHVGNDSFMNQFFPDYTGFMGGERFFDKGSLAYRVVGYLPDRDTHNIICVPARFLEDRYYVFERNEYFVFPLPNVFRMMGDATLLERVYAVRLRKYAAQYGVWPDAIREGVDMRLGGKMRKVKVFDIDPQAHRCLRMKDVVDGSSFAISPDRLDAAKTSQEADEPPEPEMEEEEEEIPTVKPVSGETEEGGSGSSSSPTADAEHGQKRAREEEEDDEFQDSDEDD